MCVSLVEISNFETIMKNILKTLKLTNMKKFFLLPIILLFFFANNSFAQDDIYSNGSKQKNSYDVNKNQNNND